jgi:hypothetical protein
MGARRLTLLLHEDDPWPHGPSYFAAGLVEAWEEIGIATRVHRGLEGLPKDDLVLPHIDRTVTPPAYAAAIDALPHVINRGVHDISKRRVSRHLLAPGQAWDGPVIVKTDRNHGGRPERLHDRRRRSLLRQAHDRWKRTRRGRDLGEDIAAGGTYRILAHPREVPARVWKDRRLVVERFLPEREGDTYFLRWYLFLGTHYRSMRVGAPDPLVKLTEVTTKAFGLPVPEQVLALRRTWGLDFGKIDYVLCDGEVVILDVNRTPSDLDPPERAAACRPYAPGLLPLLEPGWPPGTTAGAVDVDAPG